MPETQVQSLGWGDPLQKGMATHPSIAAWKITWTQEPGGLQSIELQRARSNWATDTCTLSSPVPGRRPSCSSSSFPPPSLVLPSLAWIYIYSFPVVRDPCPLSASVLQDLLCLKVYSWCLHGERWTPCPPTPLPSWGVPSFIFNICLSYFCPFCGKKVGFCFFVFFLFFFLTQVIWVPLLLLCSIVV